MVQSLKQIGLLIVGVVSAGIVIAIVELAGHAMVGMSPFVAAIIGYGAGSYGGSFLMTRFGGKRMLAILLFAILALLAGYNLAAFPHPIWFAPLALLVLAAGTYLGTLKRSANNER